MSRPSPRVLAGIAAGAAAALLAAGAVGVAHAVGSTDRTRHSAPAPAAAAAVAVRPLRRLSPPDLIVRVSGPARSQRVRRLRRMPHVRAVAVLDVGRVRVNGRRLRVLGVDPSRLRGFAPQRSAESDALWQSVARGELTIDLSRWPDLGSSLGQSVVVQSGRVVRDVRVGAFASLGLGAAQAIVDHSTAADLGLDLSHEMVVSAPRLSITSVTADVRRVFGGRAVVHRLRPRPVRVPVVSTFARTTIPAAYLRLYEAAATSCPGLPWSVLAGIGAVETGHGADTRTSDKGAEGPMQFLPSTFRAFGVDADGDGVADIQDPADAIWSAARYLCWNGAGRGGQALADAIWQYNHDIDYVRLVLRYAAAYA